MPKGRSLTTAWDLSRYRHKCWPWCGGFWPEMVEMSRKALKAKPGMTDAYQIIAVCSCSLKDADGATRAYAKLDEKSRTLVRNLCQRNGIAVSAE